jgi:putative redox protein
MKVDIQRINNAFHLEATNEKGNKVYMDGAPDIGGGDLAFRPMQMMLAAVGGCSSIDVLSILQKQRQEVTGYRVLITAEREKDKTPALFATVHLHFVLEGNLDKEKVQRAIALSVEKYCSVVKIMEKTATITHSFEVE